MAGYTSYGPVSPIEGKLGLAVIEGEDGAPTILRVTLGAICCYCAQITRLESVGISVAPRAVQAGEAEAPDFLSIPDLHAVALGARNGGVSARQRETRLPVLHHGECRWLESTGIVARFAAILPGTFRKLAGMCILVACRALPVSRVIVSSRTGRLVTALALHGGVLAGQTVFCLLVFTDGENRRDELGLVVARFALPAVRPMHELPFVNVLMAIQTAGMSQRLMEVGCLVALEARYRCVFSV